MKSIKQLIGIATLFIVLIMCGQTAFAKDEHKGFLYGRVVTESGSEYVVKNNSGLLIKQPKRNCNLQLHFFSDFLT